MTRSARPFALVLGLLAVGGAAAVVAYGAAWASVTYDVAGLRMPPLDVTGRALSPVSAAAAWISLASVVGVVATRGSARAVVGVVIAASGAAVAWGGMAFGRGPAAAAAGFVVAGRSADPAPEVAVLGPWWALALAAATVIIGCGAVLIVRGGTWPAMSARYERPRDGQPRDAWEALDRGEDPTA